MMISKWFILSAIFAILVVNVAGQSKTTDLSVKPELYDQLEYRFIGPQGNRVIAVYGIPGDPKTYYAGAASGGIFKTEDGGINWEPIFDSQPVSSIGSLAIAPTDPNIVWAGTGEISIRSNVSQGMGIYKSSDAGKTWTCMGLEKTGRIGRIVIHPKNPDIVFAAAMGHCYGPQQERGVYRTTDGGITWKQVLFVDENTGCSDIVINPGNPRFLLAGMWPMRIWPWLERKSGGPGGGIYISRDSGETWEHLTNNGLPEAPLGKIALAASPDNPNRVYALIETPKGVLWRSDDGGENWQLISKSHELTMRPAYYTRCAVAPDNANEIYFLATHYITSLDGGKTHKINFGDQAPGSDHHDMWIDPLDPDRMIVSCDLCVGISTNRGKTWDHVVLPIAQMYHVAVDNRIPYYVYGNRQDGPSTHGPSNSLTGRTIPSGMWSPVGGCECGFALPDPKNPDIVWSSCFEGWLDRHDRRTGQSRSVTVWPDSCLGWAAENLKYRFQWTFPVTISPHDSNKIYVGSQFVHQTVDNGHSWSIISPDLSTNNKDYQRPFGGITRDDESTYSCCIFAIAESPVQKGLIWAGTNDGQVQVTRNGGKSWTNVTKNIPKLPPMGIISNMEPSRYETGTCYISVDLHNAGNRDPYIFKTADYGKTWTRISATIPSSPLSYVHCVREDPVRKGLLYAGTENALYISFNDGKRWLPLQNGLPPAPVHWLVIQEHFNDLVVGTYGRGFYILDDLTPLQQLSSDGLAANVYLFAPRPAYRFMPKAEPMTDMDDLNEGFNPPYGASINFYLKEEPKEDISLTILDSKGRTVAVLKSAKEEDGEPDQDNENADEDWFRGKLTKKAGLNRVWWNLLYDKTDTVKLRTSPPEAPFVKVYTNSWRPLKGTGEPIEVLAAPGVYKLKLDVAGKIYTQKLTLRKDPKSPVSDEEIVKQVNLVLKLRDEMNGMVKMINQIEWLRKQLQDLLAVLKGEKDIEAVINTSKTIEEKLLAIEGELFQVKLTGSRDDILRLPCKLYYKMYSLAYGIMQSDYPPTTQQVEVFRMFKKRLDGYRKQLDGIIGNDLPAFHKQLKQKHVTPIFVKKF